MLEDVQTNYWFGEALCGAPEHEEKVIMQYTGLSDADGQPIYEGDVLEGTSKDGRRYVIEWEAPSFVMSCDEMNVVMDKISISVGFEIVGNIHEDPELIN